MYDGVKTSVRKHEVKRFPYNYKTAYIPYLFAFVLDVLTKHIQELVPQACFLHMI